MVPPLVLFERLSQKDKKALTAIHHSQTPKFVVRRDNGSGNRGIASDQGGKNLCKAPVLPSTEGAEVLDDNSAAVVYSGSWKLITGNPQNGNATQHVTIDPNASIYMPFSGTRIIVFGTVPNGTDPIIANYTIDGKTAQTRSVPASSQCNIGQDPFLSVTSLNGGNHYINITMVQVGQRPYMLNFFLLDPPKREDHVGELVGGIVAGIVVCLLLCISVIAFRRRTARLKRARFSSSSDEKHDGEKAVSMYTTYPFEVGRAPDSLDSFGERLSASSSSSLFGYNGRQTATMTETSIDGEQSHTSRSGGNTWANDSDRGSMSTRATRGSRGSAVAPAMPPPAFRPFMRYAVNLGAFSSKMQRNGGNDGSGRDEDGGNTGQSRWSRGVSSASSRTLVLD